MTKVSLLMKTGTTVSEVCFVMRTHTELVEFWRSGERPAVYGAGTQMHDVVRPEG